MTNGRLWPKAALRERLLSAKSGHWPGRRYRRENHHWHLQGEAGQPEENFRRSDGDRMSARGCGAVLYQMIDPLITTGPRSRGHTIAFSI